MFEIGWSEILVIAVVAIVVFPSKDLPKLLRTVGRTVGKARRMAGDFQSQFNAALREAEREVDLLETKQQIEDIKSLNPMNDVRKALDPVRSIGADIRRDIQSAVNPMANPAPAASAAAEAAGPVKTGASAAGAVAAVAGATAASVLASDASGDEPAPGTAESSPFEDPFGIGYRAEEPMPVEPEFVPPPPEELAGLIPDVRDPFAPRAEGDDR